MGKEYRKLIAWQKADELVMMIYQETMNFPKDELYALTSQLRRSDVSVPTNIAEGMARKTQKDRAHFLVLAEGSLSEFGYLIDVAKRLNYLSEQGYKRLSGLQEETAKVLHGLSRKIDAEEAVS